MLCALDRRRRLRRDRPENVVKPRGAGELAREVEKRLGLPNAALAAASDCSRIRPASPPVTTATARKTVKRQEFVRARDGEGVDRLDEEEIIGEERQDGGQAPPTACRN